MTNDTTPLAATEAERLLQCPFCESTKLKIDGWVGSTVVECENCGTIGPNSENPSRAAIAWNRRASQQSAAQATASSDMLAGFEDTTGFPAPEKIREPFYGDGDNLWIGFQAGARWQAAQATVEPVAYSPNAADWPEDFAQENGNYENRCNSCGIGFMGNKHRRVCRVCAAPDRAPSTITTWQDRMAAHYAQGKSVQCHPEAHFMRQEIEGWRCTTSTDSAADARDAARFRWLLDNYARGDGYTDIDEALNNGEADKDLRPAIDAAIAASMPQKEKDNG